jgi:hypothetical protein
MVPSSVITVTADDECLTCGGFYLGKIVLLGSFEFITDYFSSLSLYPMRGDSSASYMGSTLFRTRPSASSQAEANAAVFYASTLDTLSHDSLSTKMAGSFTSLMWRATLSHATAASLATVFAASTTMTRVTSASNVGTPVLP